jgi:galactokinase
MHEIALLCQRAENLYVGSPCGIMDQFVITMAEAGHALLVQTSNLHQELIPMNRGALNDCRIVVCNSGVRHSIATGSYGDRRHELESGQAVLREQFGVCDLGEATLDQLAQMKDSMSEASYKRCRHVLSENARVLASLGAMRAGDAVTLGELITAAHVSERDDFECSCEEIDFLVERAIALPGCYGARLTGGGFGGCTVNLVAKENVTDFVVSLRASYLEYSGTVAEMYICEAVDGAIACNQFALAGGRQ